MFSASTTLAFVAALLLATSAQAALRRGKQCCDRRTVTVTGVGRRTVPASIAIVWLGVEFSAKTAFATQNEIARRTKDLTDYLMLQRVDKLMTTGISLQTQRKSHVKPAIVAGYRGTNSISFEVPIMRSGAILDGAVRYGANQIGGISFKAMPQAARKARDQALYDAALATVREAKIVTSALGVTLGKPRAITILDTVKPTPMPAVGHASDQVRASETGPAVTVSETVEGQVEVVWDQ